MIRDPFGGWDWDGIKQLTFSIVMLFGIISVFASLGGDNWYRPYEWVWDIIAANAEISIMLAMVIVMGLWWFEQFNGGYY